MTGFFWKIPYLLQFEYCKTLLIFFDLLIKVAKITCWITEQLFRWFPSWISSYFHYHFKYALIFVCLVISANLSSFRSPCARKLIISLFHPLVWLLLLYRTLDFTDTFWEALLSFLNFFYHTITYHHLEFTLLAFSDLLISVLII